jgi:hypothetical protein
MRESFLPNQTSSGQTVRQKRRPKGYVSTWGVNFIHARNPWVTAWWSAAFPGFGHIILGSYIKGFTLVIWEVTININAHINQAILYSFTGRFNQAKAVLDQRWTLLYVAVFVYAIWDSYRTTVDLNKFTTLSAYEKTKIEPFKIDIVEINYFDKRLPWVGVAWSFLTPGLGHLYTHRLPTGFFVLAWWIVIAYFSHILLGIQETLTGNFYQAIATVKPDWLLFMPSLYIFAIYDCYVNTVEYNKLFENEQAQFLQENYQDQKFKMPV